MPDTSVVQSISNILLVLTSNHIQNPTTSHHLYCYHCSSVHHHLLPKHSKLVFLLLPSSAYKILCSSQSDLFKT